MKEKSTNSRYAVVDVETTGRSAASHKIIEIGIVLMDGDEIKETFSTLINPEASIPFYITEITGISDGMVLEAPKFYQIAKRLLELLEDRILVAHNVHFDFSFLRNEFSELGYSLVAAKLCTLRESRKKIPGLPSYSLSSLSSHFNISHKRKHRALDDALACAELLKILNKNSNLNKLEPDKISLPPGLSGEEVHSVPTTIGVYKFYDELGTLLYVGKSNNLRQRILSHFRVSFSSKKEMDFKNKISRIEYEETFSELAALLVENYLIKKLRPLYNKKLRSSRIRYGIYFKKNSLGSKLSIERIHQNEKPLLEIKNRKHGEMILEKLNSEFEIDQEFPLEEKVLAYFKKFDYPAENFDLTQGGAIIKIRKDIDFAIQVEFEGNGSYFMEDHLDLRQILVNYIRRKNLPIILCK